MVLLIQTVIFAGFLFALYMQDHAVWIVYIALVALFFQGERIGRWLDRRNRKGR